MYKIFGKFLDLALHTFLAWFLKLSIIGLIPYLIIKGDYVFAFAALIASIITIIPSILERTYKVHLPWEMDLIISLMIYLHTFCGETLYFYEKIPIWDDIIHFMGTGVVAILAFMVVYTFHFTKKLRLTLPFIFLFTFVFALAIGTIWEILEFGIDQIFAKNTQHSLENTMWDIISDFMGGLLASLIGVLYIKRSRHEERSRFTQPLRMIIKRRDER
ncbi:MAG: hypothetical protein HY999_01225 [Nitrospinae bacterium]|nr:hypothetical protein [Nitrospinota bacterium]